MNGKIYRFEDYLLDVSEQRLQKDGEDVSLPPKVFEVLNALVKRHGRLVTYGELMEEVWHETFVEETNLRYSIHTLRKTLQEDFIETVPKRGYRFKPEVESFTTEEFIGKHAGDFKKDESIKPVEKPSPKTAPVFGKYAVMTLIACLMAGIGFAAYYFWQNGKKDSGSKSARTVAVLPFEQIGEPPAPERNIQKGLLETLVFDLNKIKGLKVIQPKDLPNYPENGFNPLSIGKKFSADMGLTGNYRYEGAQTVHVNLRLFEVGGGGRELLNESISVKEPDRLKTEKILSLRIARKIFDKAAALTDEEFLKTQNIDEEAAKNYLVGQEILRGNELFRQKEGVEAFEKTIEIEPGWAKGYAKYAEALVLLHGGVPDWEKARKFAEKALELDENLPEAHLALGWYYQSKFDWENAEKSFARAIQLNPEYSEAYNELGLLLDVERRFSEAENMFHKAIELKPFDPFYLASLCRHYYYDKKSDLAVRSCREALNIDSNYSISDKHLFWIYVDLGDYSAVFKEEYGGWTPGEIERDPLAKSLKEGDLAFYWQKRIEDRLANEGKRYSPLAIATFYAQLRDRENTLKYLEEIDENLPIDILLVNPNPVFDFVRKDPRFVDLLKKKNLQP